jgi:hypothetical protein
VTEQVTANDAPLILEPGIYASVSEERYHSDPCETPSLSVSVATTLVTYSEAHAYLEHPRLGGEPFKPTAEMDFGSLCHALMLNQNRPVVLIEADDFKTKEARRLRDEAQANGAIPVLARKLVDANATVEACRARLVAEYGIHLDGESEVTIVWDEKADDGTLVRCRGRLDHVRAEAGRIYDLKFCADARPETCRNKLVSLGYAIQHAAYVRGLAAVRPELLGRLDLEFPFCEVTRPHAVTVCELAGSMRELGQSLWRRAVNRWARALNTGNWPAYGRTRAEAKPWEIERAMAGTFVELDAI